MDDGRDFFFAIANIAAEMNGNCKRRNVGAVLVVDGRIKEVAWNGMERAADMPTCDMGACPRGFLSFEEQPAGIGYSNCIYSHAETNALDLYRHSARMLNHPGWAGVVGVEIYTSSEPCGDCAETIGRAGAKLHWRM